MSQQLSEEEQYGLLLKILGEGWLTHPPHVPGISGNIMVNQGARFSREEMIVSEVVCFCDIPLADLDLHMSKYSYFGIAFAKAFLVQRGASPVFYIALNSMVHATWDYEQKGQQILAERTAIPPRAPQEQWDRYRKHRKEYFDRRPWDELHRRAEYLDRMMPEVNAVEAQLFNDLVEHKDEWPSATGTARRRRASDVMSFLTRQFFAFVKPFDDSKAEDDPDNYYMEREWRVLGNVQFDLADVVRVILPKGYAARFRLDMPGYVGQLSFSHPPE